MEWVNYLGSEAGVAELKAELEQGPLQSTLVPVTATAASLPFCANCGSLGFKKCAQCHEVHYCGKECQKAHWKSGHKERCGVPGAAQADTEAAVARSGRQLMMVVRPPAE